MSRPMSSAGAEWVMRADGDEVGAGVGVRAAAMSSVTPPETSTRHAPSSSFDRLAHLLRRHVVEHDDVDARGARFLHLLERVALDFDDPTRPARACARSTASREPEAARWLSLISTASESESRWLKPPPARTAACCSARRPGNVLRVSRMRVVAARRAHVAACERRDAGAVRQEVERDALAAEDRTQSSRAPGRASSPASTRLAVARRPTRASRAGRPGGTPRSRPRCRRGRRSRARRTRPSVWSSSMHASDVMSPSTPRSSASASATSACSDRRAAGRTSVIDVASAREYAGSGDERRRASAPRSTNRPQRTRRSSPG